MGKLIITTFSIFLISTILLGCNETEQPPPSTPTTPQIPLTSWIADGIIQANEYNGMNSYGNYEVHWRNDEEFVYIAIKAAVTGYVALGIQPGSRMKDADMILGYVKDGVPTIGDLFSTGDFGPHSPDTQLGGTDDILEFNGNEENGTTTIEFKRALTTGDEFDITLTKGTQKIIWSYGSEDSILTKHTGRGYGEITLS